MYPIEISDTLSTAAVSQCELKSNEGKTVPEVVETSRELSPLCLGIHFPHLLGRNSCSTNTPPYLFEAHLSSSLFIIVTMARGRGETSLLPNMRIL